MSGPSARRNSVASRDFPTPAPPRLGPRRPPPATAPSRAATRGAHTGVRALDVAPEEPGDDLAGVDADPQRETHAVLALEVVVQRLDGTLHGERGADRAFGVVLVRQRRAEHGHDRVADVLVDRALVTSDLPRERVEVRGEDPAEVLRIEFLGEGRRS